MQTIGNYINGEIVAPVGGAFLDNFDPSTGQVYSNVPDSDQRDVEKAVAAARDAFPGWSHTSTADRSRVLMKIAELIDKHLDQFVMAECIDNGKPLKLCRELDIPRCVKNLQHFATLILHNKSELHPIDYEGFNYTLRRPRGVCGIISPWNLPLYLLTWKVAPALAAGNTVVAKPSEVTPMTAHLFAQLCNDAGLPPGVLNIVHGTGPKAGEAIVKHPTVTTISFTGSTRAGRQITTIASPMFKRVSLEMGGKNANIVFADADPEAAMSGSLRAAFANQGQVCLCGSRLLVEQSIYDDFVRNYVEHARRLKVGDPLDESSDLGAIVSQPQLEKSETYSQLARDEGGRILCGGQRADVGGRCAEGYFFEPTVITDLDINCRTNQEEIFGPLVSIIPFKDERQAIEYANATQYGLSASLWTRDINRAHRVADQIDAGTVWVNTWMMRDLRVPFGGFKQSGVGREGGEEVMRFYAEPKNVCVKLST
jgi:aminomuconate-semialdehyde/2-hydroxymuconate-6-semialdehyde dehydrogenase